MDRIYERFLVLVGDSRDMNVTRVDELAQGRVWMGVDALEYGLVDELGGLEDAIHFAASEAGLLEYEVVEVPKVKTSMDMLTEALSVQSYFNTRKNFSAGWQSAINETIYFMNQVIVDYNLRVSNYPKISNK